MNRTPGGGKPGGIPASDGGAATDGNESAGGEGRAGLCVKTQVCSDGQVCTDEATQAWVDEALTPAQLERLNRGAARTLARSVLVQLAAGCVLAVVSWMVAGTAAGVSALVGAAACFVPNALFALRLLFGMVRPGGASPVTFFVGEFFKLGSTAFLLFVAARLGQEAVVWPALLAGLIVALKSHYWLLLFKDS